MKKLLLSQEQFLEAYENIDILDDKQKIQLDKIHEILEESSNHSDNVDEAYSGLTRLQKAEITVLLAVRS
jgi:hypothetical protein